MTRYLFTWTGEASHLPRFNDRMPLHQRPSALLHFHTLHTLHISMLILTPSSVFSVLCISIAAFCLPFKAALLLRQLRCTNSDQSFKSRYLPSTLTSAVSASYNRLCLRMTPGSPRIFPVSRSSRLYQRAYQSAGGRWLTSPGAPPPSADHSFRLPALYRQAALQMVFSPA